MHNKFNFIVYLPEFATQMKYKTEDSFLNSYLALSACCEVAKSTDDWSSFDESSKGRKTPEEKGRIRGKETVDEGGKIA